jgi:hypothetical protein
MPVLVNETDYRRIRNKPRIQQHEVALDEPWENYQLENHPDEHMIQQTVYYFPSQSVSVTGFESSALSDNFEGITYSVVDGTDSNGDFFILVPGIEGSAYCLKFYLDTKEVRVLKYLSENETIGHTCLAWNMGNGIINLIGHAADVKAAYIPDMEDLTNFELLTLPLTDNYDNICVLDDTTFIYPQGGAGIVVVDISINSYTIVTGSNAARLPSRSILDKTNGYYYTLRSPDRHDRVRLSDYTYQTMSGGQIYSFAGQMAYNENCPVIAFIAYIRAAYDPAFAGLEDIRLYILQRNAADIKNASMFTMPQVIASDYIAPTSFNSFTYLRNSLLVEKDGIWYALFFTIDLTKVIIASDITGSSPTTVIKNTGLHIFSPYSNARFLNTYDFVDESILYVFYMDEMFKIICDDPMNILIETAGFPFRSTLNQSNTNWSPWGHTVIAKNNWLICGFAMTSPSVSIFSDIHIADLDTMRPVDLEKEGWHAYIEE